MTTRPKISFDAAGVEPGPPATAGARRKRGWREGFRAGRRASRQVRRVVSALTLLTLTAPCHGAEEEKEVEMSIPPAVQRSIDRGLAYLARTQLPDGSWPTKFGQTTGIVGSCALAFMACGQLPGRGQYGVSTERAVDFLVRSTRTDGLVYREGMPGMPMYHHGIAVLALAEAWGTNDARDDEIRKALTRAIDLIVRIQSRRGGWRYQPRPTSGEDMSVTVIQMLALRAAHDVGVYVPKETIDGGLRYIRSCYDHTAEGFKYQPSGGPQFNMTAAGVLSLQLAGEYDAPEVTDGLKNMLRQFFGITESRVDHFYYYGRYYAAQCVYQAQSKLDWGVKAWNVFYPAIARELMSKQMASGAWHSLYDEYGTAQSLLVLAIPNRYLPIYQR